MKRNRKKTGLCLLLTAAVCLLCAFAAGGTTLTSRAAVQSEAETGAVSSALGTEAAGGTDYSLFLFFGGILLIVIIAVIAVVAAVSGTAGAIASEEDDED